MPYQEGRPYRTRIPFRPFTTATRTLLVLATLGTQPTLSMGSSVAAQEPPEDALLVPGIVVTATRTPVGRAALPSPVSVVTGASLRERGIRTVADALRTLPGVNIIQSGSAGAQTSLFLRGGESDYVRVLVDGVPINEAGGAIDLADLSTDVVERIEVVRGPGSVLYGSDAASGVVQVFTRRGRGAPLFELEALGGIGERRYEDGRYGLSDLSATISGGSGSIGYAAGGSRSATAGAYPFNNDRTVRTANARVAWMSESGSDLAVATRFSDSESGFPTDGAGNLADENQAFDRRLWTTSLEAGRPFGDAIEARIQFGYNRRRHVSRDEQDGPEDVMGTYESHFTADVSRRTVDARLNASLPKSTLTLGASHDRSDGSSVYDSDGEFGPFSAEANYARSNTATYAQLLSEPLAGLHATLGGRIDDNEAFGRFATHRVGASWNGWTGGRIRAAIGRAFREPTFGENYGSGFGDIGNDGLLPERIRSWEAGVEQEVGAFLFAATWFDQTFHDLIQFTFATANPSDPNYVNVGAAESVGLELSADAVLGPLALSGAYTHLRTVVLDPGLATNETFVEGQALLRRPRHSGSVTARWTFGGGVLGASLHTVGRRADVDFSAAGARVNLPSHTTLDLSGEHGLPGVEGARLLVRVENALDADYEGIAGFPALGRIVRIGARLSVGGD